MEPSTVALRRITCIPDNDNRGIDSTAFSTDQQATKSPGSAFSGASMDRVDEADNQNARGAADAKYVINDEEWFDDDESWGCVGKAQEAAVDFWRAHRTLFVWVLRAACLLLYSAYFVYALSYRFGDEGSVRLLLLTLLVVLIVVLKFSSRHLAELVAKVKESVSERERQRYRRIFRWSLYVISTVTMVTLLILLVAMRTPDNLISLAGLAGFIMLTYVTSVNPARVNWHPVFWGFSLQFFFAVIILKTQSGFEAFNWLGDRATEFLAYSEEGAEFAFGKDYREHFFAFAIMPMIVFFSAVISVLYYLGAMQAVVRVIGSFLALCLDTTPAESLVAAANIFMGMTDSPLMVRPFIHRMTRSELHAVMTGGFATIAGSVLGAYIGFGVPANHLLSASVMSAPAALAVSKLTYPETEDPKVDADEYIETEKAEERNLIEAASAGATWSLALVGCILVNVLAFLSILKFVNVTLTWAGDRVGVEGLSFEMICSYVLYPVALFMGTEPRDCRRVAELVGIKTFTNEFIAYVALQKFMQNGKHWANYTSMYNASDPTFVTYLGDDVRLVKWNMTLENGFMSRRSEVISTYALCGFSNFGSMGILLGGLSAMAPERRHDMAGIVLRAMIAGNVACFFTACIAGLFFEDYDAM